MEIRKLNQKDLLNNIESFCDLYRKAFTAPVSRTIIEQRYLENPYKELLMYVAVDNGKIIANYSAVPISVYVDGIERKSALSLNTMTDPEYEGRGLFTKLATALYEHLANNEYAMIIGFPNNIANHVFNTRLGWSTVLEIPTLKLPLNTCQIAVDDKNTTFSDTFDGLISNEYLDYIHVSLSEEYVAWRFRNNKEKQYRVLSLNNSNWLVYQFYNEEINITEISCDDKNSEQMLISKIVSLGKREGYSYITTWCKINTERHNYLEKMGFRISSPIRSFGLRCFDESIKKAVYDPRKWFIQMGDDNTY